MFIIAQQKQQVKLILNAVKEATVNQMPKYSPPPPPPAPQEPAPKRDRPEVVEVEPEEYAVDSKAVVLSEKKKPRKYEI